MKTRTALTGFLAGAALLAMSMTAVAQTTDDDHAAHHPEAETTAPEGEAAGVDSSTTAEGMSGMMEKMTPEMMQMMMRMMGGMRGGAMAEGMPGAGLMGEMPMIGMAHGHHGAMAAQGIGPGALYGIAQGSVREMTPTRVGTFLSHLLDRHGNPRLTLGEIVEAEDGSIIAEIVTVDGSLVQRLAFNRYPGLFRQID